MFRLPTLLSFFIYSAAISQSVGIGTTTPHNSSTLDITSSGKGLLIPRLTTSERNAIAAPANGLMIYNVTENDFNFFNGSYWQKVSGVPKGAIVLSRNFNDSSFIKQGFKQDGYLRHDYVKQDLQDTTIPSMHWYEGNRFDENNATAPGCGTFVSCFTNDSLFVFKYDTVFIYSRSDDLWTYRAVTDPASNTVLSGFPHVQPVNGSIILWDQEYLRGTRYFFETDTWQVMSNINAPLSRKESKFVWTGTELIVWGGINSAGTTFFNTGARYDPVPNLWTTIPAPAGFAGRINFSIVWAGTKLIIWGGKSTVPRSMTTIHPCNGSPSTYTFNYDSIINYSDGRIFDPNTNVWTPMAASNAPGGRYGATAVWAEYQLVITGGALSKPPETYCHNCGNIAFPSYCPKFRIIDSLLNTGAIFNPSANEWQAIPNAPKRFANAKSVWDVEQFIHIYMDQDTIISYEPSAGDWFTDLIPPLIHVNDIFPSMTNWWLKAPGNIILYRPAACLFDNTRLFNLQPTPVTLKEISATTVYPSEKFYLYQKE